MLGTDNSFISILLGQALVLLEVTSHLTGKNDSWKRPKKQEKAVSPLWSPRASGVLDSDSFATL
jgi:hypothetical protein